MDVAGIVSELRAVQKGIEETILLLERSQPFSVSGGGGGGHFGGASRDHTANGQWR